MTKKNEEPTPIPSPDGEGNQTQGAEQAAEKKPKGGKADAGIWVSMIKDGITIHGVHPDAVPAHEAIGYKLVPVEKSIEPADRTANNG